MQTSTETTTTAAPAAPRIFPAGTSEAMKRLYRMDGVTAVAICRGDAIELLEEREGSRRLYETAFRVFDLVRAGNKEREPKHARFVLGKRTLLVKMEDDAIFLVEYHSGDPVAKSLQRGVRRASRRK
jgi:hypothetical protein